MIFSKKKILVWCDDPPEDPVVSIFAGCLDNHDRAHSLKTEKVRDQERKWDGVGVMKDKEMKIEDVKDRHTLGWTSYILLVKFLWIDSAGEVVNLFEV